MRHVFQNWATLAVMAVILAIATTPALAGLTQVMDPALEEAEIGLMINDTQNTAKQAGTAIILGPGPTLEEAIATTPKKPTALSQMGNFDKNAERMITATSSPQANTPDAMDEVAMRNDHKPNLAIAAATNTPTYDVNPKKTTRSNALVGNDDRPTIGL